MARRCAYKVADFVVARNMQLPISLFLIYPQYTGNDNVDQSNEIRRARMQICLTVTNPLREFSRSPFDHTFVCQLFRPLRQSCLVLSCHFGTARIGRTADQSSSTPELPERERVITGVRSHFALNLPVTKVKRLAGSEDRNRGYRSQNVKYGKV